MENYHSHHHMQKDASMHPKVAKQRDEHQGHDKHTQFLKISFCSGVGTGG